MKITLNIPSTVELTYMMKRKDGWFVSVKCPDDDLDPDGVSLGLVSGEFTNPIAQIAIDKAVRICLSNREKMIEYRKNPSKDSIDSFLECLGLDVYLASKP